jgi:chemosensory pili system protein ChpA (sensor histidine kinase/response regulator)
MSETTAVGGLKWVKGELIDSLRRVRGQLEAIISSEGPADCSDAITALYEVRGVLAALQLPAPARLAEEMQRLMERLAAGSLPNRDMAAEALMLALIQLPNHLDRLGAGYQDPPVILLPSINDLRVSRGARPLKAAELAAPSPALTDIATPTPEVLKALASVVVKVRPHFHRYLLQVFQGDRNQGLIGLGRIFNQLHRFFDHGVICDAFRVADAVVAGVSEGSVSLTPTTKALLGRVDTVFKPVLETEPSWPGQQARRLIDELLGLLADRQSTSQLVLDLQARYGGQASAGEPPEAGESARRSALETDALATLAAEVLRELAGIKDRLDLFARGGVEGPEQLTSIERNLRQLANTLGIGNDPTLVDRFHGLADQIGRFVSGQAEPDDASLMGLAEDLLAVEDALREIAPTAEGGGLDSGALLGATLREARADLGKAKQAIADYALDPGDTSKLGDAPHMLPGVAAALHMLGEEAAADVVDGVAAVLRRRFLEGGQLPSSTELDLLADAIAGVDLYMEGHAEGASFGDHLLAQARKAVQALGAELPGFPVTGRLSPSPALPERGDVRQDLPAADLGLAAERFGKLSPTYPVPEGPESRPDSDHGLVQTDSEFLEIFLEEAREERGRIDETLARWIDDPADREALATLRRSFHTLKGSGRLVGATRLADAAAVTENLLGQILSGLVTASGAVLEEVAATARALPSLIEAEAGTPPSDLSPLLRDAAGLVARSAVEPSPAWQPGSQAPAVSVTSEPPSPEEEPIEADSELLDIFVTEARAHISTLTDFLAKASRGPDLRPERELLRALHTLRGSSRMAGINSVAGVSGALEKLFADLDARELAVGPDLCNLLARACEGLVERLDRLPHSGPEVQSLAAVEREAAEYQHRLVALAPAPSTHPERGLDTLPESGLIDLLTPVSEMPEEGAPPAVAPETPEAAPWAQEAFALAAATSAEPSPTGDIQAYAEAAGPTEPAAPEVETPTEPEPVPAEATVAPEAVVLEVSAEAQPKAIVAELLAEAEPEAIGSSAGLVPELEVRPAAIAVEVPAEAEAESELILLAASAEPAPEVVASQASIEQEAPTVPAGERPRQPAAAGAPAELAVLFLEDAREILDHLDDGLRRWQLAPQERGPLESIQRRLHTLKGSARLSGLSAIGDLSHALESALTAITRGELPVTDDALELAQRTLDTLSDQVDAVEQGAVVPVAAELIAALAAALEAARAAAEGAAVAQLAPAEGATAPRAAAVTPPAAVAPAAPGAAAKIPAPPAAQIRVRADLLNRLVNNAAEISIYRGRLARQNSALGFSLAELDRTVARLREQLRQLDLETEAQILYRFERDVSEAGSMAQAFDPLELDRFSTLQQRSRSITETVNDLVSVKTLLADLQRETSDLLVQQERIAGDVQDGLLRARMVPFVQIVPRLHRLVRQTAESLGKLATLEVRGPEVELDRGILDRLGAPLEHLLRNALAHGIENPAARRAAGKEEQGAIVLVISREGNDVLITLRDDGAGMDLDAIRRRALERGLLLSGVPVTDEELLQLTMVPGFSTVERVTQIAGRGVGLDVVSSEIKRLSGTVSLTSERGRGTEFVIRLPLTLAIIDAVLVTVGNVTHAIPTGSIRAVTRISRDDLNTTGARPGFDYLGGIPRDAPGQAARRRSCPRAIGATVAAPAVGSHCRSTSRTGRRHPGRDPAYPGEGAGPPAQRGALAEWWDHSPGRSGCHDHRPARPSSFARGPRLSRCPRPSGRGGEAPRLRHGR